MNRLKLLVISEGPPPLGDTVAEGGALRAWGLSKGLAGHGFDVTFAYRSTFKLADNALGSPIPKGIKVATWNGDLLKSLLEENKIIVMRYAMGESMAIVDRLTPEHILVSDSYIPISVEVSARKSNAKDENDNYLRLQESSAETSRRSDYFLYASPAQKLYYIGYLSGLNKLNPTTYDDLEDRMFEVPYGVEPADKRSDLLSHKPATPTLLWYGAFYSWFDITELVEPIKKIKQKHPKFKLLIAGAKNPYNKDPGLVAHYEATMRSLEELGDMVEHIPWHPYDERFSVYSRGSAIITYNHLGLENNLAWRTRLMDFILSDRPILTNGGDPLGEDLIDRGIAFRIDKNSLEQVFEKISKQPPKQSLFNAATERYAWANITKDLAATLNSPTRMKEAEMIKKDFFSSYTFIKIKKTILLPIFIVRYANENGLRQTFNRILRRLSGKL